MVKTEYTIYTDKINPVTLAVASDLHERNPQEVLSILSSSHPNYILVPGDLFENHKEGEDLDKYDENTLSRFVCSISHSVDRFSIVHPRLLKRKITDANRDNAYQFLREANKIAPVYMSVGNHSLYFTKEDMAVINETGTVLLNNEYKEDNGIIFGGLTSRCAAGSLNTEFIKRFSKQDGYKVLLCHHPEYYCHLRNYHIDLIISGHAHGGQMRLFNHGMFAPGQGIWPKYTKGVYENERLIVSAGCSNTSSVPRIDNPTEVVIIKINKADTKI